MAFNRSDEMGQWQAIKHWLDAIAASCVLSASIHFGICCCRASTRGGHLGHLAGRRCGGAALPQPPAKVSICTLLKALLCATCTLCTQHLQKALSSVDLVKFDGALPCLCLPPSLWPQMCAAEPAYKWQRPPLLLQLLLPAGC